MLQSAQEDAYSLDRNGLSAFHWSLWHGVEHVACMLQNERVDPNLLTSRGEHALELTQDPEIINLLLGSGRVDPPVEE
jgi:ankyrin repeat protein